MTIIKKSVLFVVTLSMLLLVSCNFSIFDHIDNRNNETAVPEQPYIDSEDPTEYNHPSQIEATPSMISPTGVPGTISPILVTPSPTPTPTMQQPATTNTQPPVIDDGDINASPTDLAVFTGSLRDYSSKDYYSFVLNSKGTVKIELQIPYDNVSTWKPDWEVTLYNSKDTNNALLSCTFSARKAGDFATSDIDRQASQIIGLDAGTYSIKVNAGSDYSSNKYTLTVKYVKTNNCEVEPNANAVNASVLALNATSVGALQYVSDKDFYVFKINKKGTVKLELQIPFDNDSTWKPDWEITLFDGNNTNDELIINTFSARSSGDFATSNMDKQVSPIIGLDAGTYFVKIETGNDYSSSKYLLTVQYVETDDCEAEPNNTATHASAIALNTSYIGALQYASDKDFYVFKMNKNGDVTIELQIPFDDVNTWKPDWEVSLFDGNSTNNALLEQTFSSRKTDDFASGSLDRRVSKTISLGAGTYYIRIVSGSDFSSKQYILKILG